MRSKIWDDLDRITQVCVFVSTIFVLYFVSEEYGFKLAIKGSYILFAVLISGYMYSRVDTNYSRINDNQNKLSSRFTTTKLILSLSIICLFVTSLSSERIIPLILFLSASYVVILFGISRYPFSSLHILNISAVFLVVQISKYVTSGIYFGSGDILKHMLFVNKLVSSGSYSAIPTNYSLFPGLHLLVGSVFQISGLSINSSILITGVVVFTFVVLPLIFLFARYSFGSQAAILSLLVGASLTQMIYYSLYFYPQSLAFPMILLSLHFGIKSHSFSESRFIIVSFILSFVALFTHHFSFILISPIVAIIVISGLSGTSGDSFHAKGAWPVGITILSAIGYWILVTGFFQKFLFAAVKSLVGASITTPKTLRNFYFGIQIENETIEQVALSLLSIDGLYYMALAALVITGFLYLIQISVTKKELKPIPVLGVISIPIILKTPISFKSLTRLQFPVSVFFSIIAGLGLYNAIQSEGRSRVYLGIIVMICIGITGPLVAAEDLPQERPTVHEFSDSEYQQLEQVQHLQRNKQTITTLWATRQGLYSQGIFASGRVELRSRGIVHPQGVFVYRNAWDRQQLFVFTSQIYSSKVYMSRQWLADSITSSNKIYSGGKVGATWSRNRTTFAPSAV